MRCPITCVALLFALLAPMGIGAPVTGGVATIEKIGPEGWKTAKRFRGGERAAVLVANKFEHAAKFHIAVYDSKGILVAEDMNKTSSKEDMVAVIWYPARDAEYRIEIKNLEGRVNRCFVTIK